MKIKNILIVLFLSSFLPPLFGESLPQPPTLVDQYSGGYRDDYLLEIDRVRTFLGLGQQTLSTQLGLLQATQGFYHPVRIRFDDGAPAISYSAYFYIQPDSRSGENFSQEMVVNVEAYARRRKAGQGRDPELRSGFNYAMTQLILYDLLQNTSAQKLPLWVHEGLSVYMAGDGMDLVKEVASATTKSRVSDLVGEINRPYPNLSRLQWARYFLAIQYIYETGGVNGFQSFVRAVVSGTSAADAIRDSLSQDWSTFKENVQAYSSKIYNQFAAEDPKTYSR